MDPADGARLTTLAPSGLGAAARLASGAVAGAVSGLGATAVDRWLLAEGVVLTSLSTDAARTIVAGLVGPVVTIAVFALWMRTVMAGLVASEFSPRTVGPHLVDRFQLDLLSAMTAALGFVVAVVATLPSTSLSRGSPPVAIIGAFVVLGVVLALTLTAIRRATTSLSVSNLVGQLAAHVSAVLADRDGPGEPLGGEELAEIRGRATSPVEAGRVGWVAAIDLDAIVAALPAGSSATLEVQLGDFARRGTPVVRTDAELDGSAATAIRDAVHLDPAVRPTEDVAYALGRLVDVARRTLATYSNDTSTAFEALSHLVAGFETMLASPPPGRLVRGDGDRRLVDVASWEVSDHIRVAFEPLRVAAADDPVACRYLLRALAELATIAEDTGRDDALAEIGHQAARLREGAQAHLTSGDVEVVRQLGHSLGLWGDERPARSAADA